MNPTEALQAWLALEHESVWLYPIIGARFDDLGESARSSFAAHRNTRDSVLARLRARDVTPVGPLLAYDDGALKTSAEASAAARGIESRISAVCLALVGASEGETRSYAVTHLGRAALAELTWGAAPKAFPGLP